MIATTIEQSERLLACGIKAKTADMSYLIIPPIDREFIEYHDIQLVATPYTDSIVWGKELKKPAWSLSALLDKVLPMSTNSAKGEDLQLLFGPDVNIDTKWSCYYFCSDYEVWASDPIEACVKMVELLHKKGLLPSNS